MANVLDTILRMTTRTTESSLLLARSALRGVQGTVDDLAGGRPGRYSAEPPFEGPTTLDDVTSDLADRWARILWKLWLGAQDSETGWREILESPQRSFAAFGQDDPRRWLTLPLQLPLSFGTLVAEQSLKMLYVANVVGTENVPPFVAEMTDALVDIPIFASLQYGELLRRQKARVRRSPEDAKARVELGRTYMKLGLYREAADELEFAARTPDVRAYALQLRAIAGWRAGDFHQGVRDGAASLALDRSNNRTRFWTWLNAHELGGYPAEVPQDLRDEVRAGRNPSRVEFEEVAGRMGLDKTSAGRGTAVLDMNGDGNLDLVIASAHGGCSLYRNNGDGTFTDVTVGSGLDHEVNCFAVVAGDYDNDGFEDLFITRLGFNAGDSKLYRNNGDGTFTDVTGEAGVACWGPGFAAHWVDYDCDGNLDLFVCHNQSGLFVRKTPNLLFRNNGDGTFTEVSQQAGLDSCPPTIGAAWGDYDNDGFPDLFISNGVGRPQLYHNNGDGTFTEVSREAGIDDICFGSVSVWCDYDNDGWLDIVQFVWSPEEDVLHTLLHGQGPARGCPTRIFQNNRDGTFKMRSRDIGITGCWGSMSGNVGDFDNDGHIDLLLGNGDPHIEITQPPVLLANDGSGRFTDISFTAGMPYTGKGHGANLADLQGDGRLCIIVATGGAYPGDLLTTSVYRPKTLPGNYLNVRVRGTRSNRSGIGTRLALTAGGRTQHRLVSGGTAFGSLPLEQHFGLGDLRQVESLDIRWPSGLSQRIEGLPVNDSIRVTEGQAGWERIYPGPKTVPIHAELQDP